MGMFNARRLAVKFGLIFDLVAHRSFLHIELTENEYIFSQAI